MVQSAALQSISIPCTETRNAPSPHVVYAITVTLPVRSWTIWRRYSEFVSLHSSLLASVPDRLAPPAPLPPKHAGRRTIKAITGLGGLLSSGTRDEDQMLLRERQDSLERYLRAIVSSPDPRWRETTVFCEFIGLPANSSATKVFGISEQGAASTAGTGGADFSNGQGGTSKSGGAQQAIAGAATAAGRSARVPGAYEPPSGPATTRRLGAKAQETERTRALDDEGLLALQRSEMDSQDTQLEGLAAILRRQRAMGLAINQELLEQNELLDELGTDLDRTEVKMKGAEGQMRKLGK